MKRSFYNLDEFCRSYPSAYNIISFAEVQSKADGVDWNFLKATVDRDDDDICVAEFDLPGEQGSRLKFRFVRRRGQMNDSYEILTKTCNHPEHSDS